MTHVAVIREMIRQVGGGGGGEEGAKEGEENTFLGN